MQNKEQSIVYSKNVIEFATVAYEFCTLLENVSRYSKKDFIEVSVKMLPLLYLKASVLPKLEQRMDDELESFVDEFTYESVRKGIRAKLTRHDDYLEVFKDDIERSETPVVANVSEDLADIYQDLRNFCGSYKIGVEDIMNDAVCQVFANFKDYWGQRLVNTLRALHSVFYGADDLEDEKPAADDAAEPDSGQEAVDPNSWYAQMLRNRQK